MRHLLRDLFVAGVVQVIAIVCAGTIMDLGQFMAATVYLSFGYWLSVLFVVARGRKGLKRGDRLFIRYGLLPILVVGIPAFFFVWNHKKVF